MSHSQHAGLPLVQKENSDKCFLWPLNHTPLCTLESWLYMTRLQLTSPYHPWTISTLFTFPGLCGFLHPICCFAPFVFLFMFLPGPGMYSSTPLHSWGNPVSPSSACEMIRLRWNSGGFRLRWTDPSASFQPPGAVNFSHSSHFSGLLL